MQNLRKKKQVYTTTEHTVKLTGDWNKETDHYFNECSLTFLVGLYGPVLPLKLSPNSNRPEDKKTAIFQTKIPTYYSYFRTKRLKPYPQRSHTAHTL